MTPIWAQMMLLRLESVCAWVWRAERVCVRKFQMRVCRCWKLSMLYFRKSTMIPPQSDSISLNYAFCLFWRNMKVIRPVDFKLLLFENNDMNMSLRGKCRFSLVQIGVMNRSFYSKFMWYSLWNRNSDNRRFRSPYTILRGILTHTYSLV